MTESKPKIMKADEMSLFRTKSIVNPKKGVEEDVAF